MVEWAPVGNPSTFEFLPVDTRIVEEIQRSPKKLEEQGGCFLDKWGGPSNYNTLAKLSPEERLVYVSTLQGLSDPAAIADAVSTSETFGKAFSKLERQNLLEKSSTREEVVTEILKGLQKKGLVRYA